MAFIVASLCTLVLLLSEVYDERDHVNEDFAHYLGDRRRDCTVIRTFPEATSKPNASTIRELDEYVHKICTRGLGLELNF
jgi:hypothetical protein